MPHVHKNDDALAAMAEGDPDEPVVMLNLLKYRDVAQPGHGVENMSGRNAYGMYGRAFAELNPRFGGEPIWMGRCHHAIIGDAAEGDDWDICILVRYPTRKQFVAMFNDPDYAAIAPMRAAALIDSRIVEMTQLLPKE